MIVMILILALLWSQSETGLSFYDVILLAVWFAFSVVYDTWLEKK